MLWLLARNGPLSVMLRRTELLPAMKEQAFPEKWMVCVLLAVVDSRCCQVSFALQLRFYSTTNGFVSNYHVWTHQGEKNRRVEVPATVLQGDKMWEQRNKGEGCSLFQRMVNDVGGPEVRPEEPLNAEAQKFYDMMRAAEEPIWPGNDRHSTLSAAINFLECKCRYQASNGLMNEMSEFVHQLIPKDNKLAKNSYNIKKLVRGLGFLAEVIHYCKNMCMTYWDKDAGLTVCKVCGHDRRKPPTAGNSKRRKTNVPFKKMHYFPITPRLLRLDASRATAKYMRWHAEHEMENSMMNHPSDSTAWKHFSELHQDFSSEVRHIILGCVRMGFNHLVHLGNNTRHGR
ncbi:uncharacterized protein LOC126677298 [Mercurialis annua]|uniref:uncharacterized protein LOC126677298 n=1 Tax=Mercurialis annua TaxID=3986 RepID=UPI00215E7B6B|nr:uncharacterized protein LOC126677298 [Mercurialis annua]